MSKVYFILDEGEKRYSLDNNFSYNSAMTLTLDLETWLKVTVYPLPKGTRVKYEPICAKGKECSGQEIPDRQKDRLINKRRAQGGALITGLVRVF